MSSALDRRVLDDLAEAAGAGGLVTDPEVTAGYTTDWTGRFVGETPAVVRPASVAAVAAVVEACGRHALAVVPQGGNTGLVGGSVPLAGEVVLSLGRLAAVDVPDAAARQVEAGAGAPLAAVQGAAAAVGTVYPVDLAARDTATVGGTVATNAGGIHLLRYGGTRQRLAGIEAVLADGGVVSHLGGLPKDNTGYDLAQLLCGSEGTLGVVTRVRLSLAPRYGERVVALIGFDDRSASLRAAVELRRALESIEALEWLDGPTLALTGTAFDLPRVLPETVGAALLVEAADHEDPTEELAAAIEDLAGIADVAVAGDAARRAELWRHREEATSAVNTVGVPHKLDVSVPLGELDSFVVEVGELVAGWCDGARVWIFGHAGDGNLHVNVTGVDPADDDLDGAVLELTARLGGSISAEHGIGTAKKRWLHLSRGPDEIGAMRAVKRALDPRGILNPNVLLP